MEEIVEPTELDNIKCGLCNVNDAKYKLITTKNIRCNDCGNNIMNKNESFGVCLWLYVCIKNKRR